MVFIWGTNGFTSSDFTTAAVQGHKSKKNALVKRQKIDDGPVVSVMKAAIHVNWIAGVACKTISELERDYRRYCGILDNDVGQPADIPGDVVDDLYNVFGQRAL